MKRILLWLDIQWGAADDKKVAELVGNVVIDTVGLVVGFVVGAGVS